MLISICIATHKRPSGLAKLLGSIEKQQLPNDVELEIIVIDNDAEQSGAPVIGAFQQKSALRCSYACEPVKNISLARNAAVRVARGKFIFFIDDDEVAAPDCIAKLLHTMRNCKADGVFGRVAACFHKDTPEWIRRGSFFHAAFAKIKTGAPATTTWSGNCLIRTDLLKNHSPSTVVTGHEESVYFSGPFDPAYGVTGGGDSHLFGELMQAGAKFVYCYEAVAYEDIPPDRTNATYLLKRYLRTGNCYTRRLLERARKARVRLGAIALLKAVVYCLAAIVLAALSIGSRTYFMHWLTKLASNVGHFMAVFRWHYQEYRT